MKYPSLLNTGAGLALTAAFISGTNTFLTKVGVSVVADPIYYTTLKNIVTVALLLGALMLLRKWSEVQLLSKKEWAQLCAVGIIGGAIPFALFFTGLSMTSALSGALIQKTLVFWVLLLAYPLLKERLPLPAFLGVLAVFAANFMLGGFNNFHVGTGEILILAATLLWAVETIIVKKILARVSPLVVASARMIIGSVLLLGFLGISGRLVSVTHVGALGWSITVLSGMLLFGYVLAWYSALAKAPATFVSALLLPATLITNMLSIVLVTHTITGAQLGSAGLTAIGVGLLISYGAHGARSLNAGGRLQVEAVRTPVR